LVSLYGIREKSKLCYSPWKVAWWVFVNIERGKGKRVTLSQWRFFGDDAEGDVELKGMKINYLILI